MEQIASNLKQFYWSLFSGFGTFRSHRSCPSDFHSFYIQMTTVFSPPVAFVNATAPSREVSSVVLMDEQLMEELVRSSGVVDGQTLAQVQLSATTFNKTVAEVLFESGFIASADLKALISAHNFVKKGLLHKPWAQAALRKSLTEFLPFESMLESMDLGPDSAFTDSLLTELTLASNLITPLEFDRARKYALAYGLTLGQSLVRSGFITMEAYKILLNGLALHHSGVTTDIQLRQNVTHAGLRNLQVARTPLPYSLVGYTSYADSPELLGALELLVAAHCVNELSLLGLIEVSIERDQTFAETFERLAILSPVVLNTALKMQSLVVRGTCTSEMAIQVLQDTVKQP